MDSLITFEETSLPFHYKFDNNLLEEDDSIEDYKHACTVWNKLKMKILVITVTSMYR